MMATRRPAPARLVEGRTYNTPVPRQTVRLGRSRVLVSPEYQRTLVALSGLLVPQGEPARIPRQKPVVGSVVRALNQRRTRIAQSHGCIDPVIAPGFGPGNPSYLTTYTDRVSGQFPMVVNAVSACGKFVRLVALARFSSSRITQYWDSTSAKFAVQGPGQWRTNDRGVRDYVIDPVTQEQADRYINGAWSDTSDDDSPHLGSLVRTTAITHLIDLSDLPPVVLSAVRNRAREALRDNLYTRLAFLERDRRGVDISLRGLASVRGESGQHTRAMLTRRVKISLTGARTSLAEAALYAADDEHHRRSARGQAFTFMAGAYKSIVDYHCSAYQSMDHAQQRAQAMLDKFCLRQGIPPVRKAPGCGHFHDGETVALVSGVYGDTAEFCPACAATAVEIINREGNTVRAVRTIPHYTWSDGTRRLTREPDVIGHRHSGKGVVGFVAPLSGAVAGSYITLGLELEMQSVDANERGAMARKLKHKLESANLLDAPKLRKYLHFEDDGSTGPGGFEMVTGYTDLATHGKLLYALLTKDGAPAWAGKLRSHDARSGSCGIHVHVQKPTSLIHASKIRYFINAATSAQLVTDVARRYNDGFARINNRITDNTPEKAAAHMAKQAKGYSRDKLMPAHTRLALDRMNESSRYEALNFQNRNTVEFRIFRGSLLFVSVMACLEFTHAVWHFCRFTSATQLTPEAFVDWINHQDNRADTRNLRIYLKRKGWDCYVPKDRKNEAQPVTKEDITELV